MKNDFLAGILIGYAIAAVIVLIIWLLLLFGVR